MTRDGHDLRRPLPEDADTLGRVHTQVWREAYAGLMPPDYLDGLDAQASADRWRLRLEMDEPDGVVVVGTDRDGEIVGFASAGPSRDEEPPTAWELYAINVLASHHGSGIADDLVRAAVGLRPASLWVLRDNGRARSFYTRWGFVTDGATKRHEATGAGEVRMVRAVSRPPQGGA